MQQRDSQNAIEQLQEGIIGKVRELAGVREADKVWELKVKCMDQIRNIDLITPVMDKIEQLKINKSLYRKLLYVAIYPCYAIEMKFNEIVKEIDIIYPSKTIYPFVCSNDKAQNIISSLHYISHWYNKQKYGCLNTMQFSYASKEIKLLLSIRATWGDVGVSY